MFRFSSLSLDILHCGLILAIRLPAATFIAPYWDTVAPRGYHVPTNLPCPNLLLYIRCSFSLKQPLTVTVRSYKVRKKEEFRIRTNSFKKISGPKASADHKSSQTSSRVILTRQHSFTKCDKGTVLS
jgi:hypothetical protein